MSQFETLEVSVSGEIGAIQLNRPAQLNALSRQTLQDLASAARWFDNQQQVKVVVVSGQGRSFSAGFDLNTFSTPDPNYSTRDIADIGLNRAEWIIGCLRGCRLGQRVEQGGLAHIGKTHNTAFETHKILVKN